MRSRFSFIPVFGLVLFVTFVGSWSASAQVRLGVYVTPIPNAPFSAQVKVERSMVQADGSISNLKTSKGIGRDNQGRIYNQAATLLPASSMDAPQIVSILIYDPQTRISTTLLPQNRTYTSGTVNRPPDTVPPALLDASPAAASIPQSEFTKQEDLGNREIEGVPVHGVRQTQTIPDKNDGKEIVVTDELWYSADLRINMLIKHNDPRTGSVTMTVAQVKRTEPDPALFEIPEGYTRAGQ